MYCFYSSIFCVNDTATTDIYPVRPTLSLHDALPIYLSMEMKGQPGEGKILADIDEVHQALHVGAVTLHSKIISRVPQTSEDGKQYMKRVETTPGRMLIDRKSTRLNSSH